MAFQKNMRVLIVDDTSTSRMLIRDALEQLGMTQIASANDGEEALKAMVTAPSHLVISDLNMPKLDGLGLLKAIRAHPPTKKTPFIILTGKSDRAVIEQAAKLGVNNYITKPFTLATLKTGIEAVVGKLQ